MDISQQIINISKAGAYDVVSKHRDELIEQNKAFRSSLNSILHELAFMNPEEVVNKPAIIIKKIASICNDALTQNRPL